MGIGDRRLLQVLVDAAAPANKLGFQFDRHARAVRLIDPFDAVLLDVEPPLFRRGDVDASPLPLRILGSLRLRVDLDFVVVGRLSWPRFRR